MKVWVQKGRVGSGSIVQRRKIVPNIVPNAGIDSDFGCLSFCFSITYSKKGCDPDRIRTCDLLIRSQLLYPAELRDLFDSAKVRFFMIAL